MSSSPLERAELRHRRGRFAEVIEIARSVAEPERPIRLDVLAAIARQASTEDRPSVPELRELLDRVTAEDPASVPLAAQALACEQRLVGDPGVVMTCLAVLGPLLSEGGQSPREHAAAVRAQWTDPTDRSAVAELLRVHGQIALLVEEIGGADLGLRLISAAIDLASERGSTASERAWLAYLEALLFRRTAAEVVLEVRASAMELWRDGHENAALRVGELAVLYFYAGEYDECAAWIVRAKQAADSGNDLALLPLEALSVALAVVDDPHDASLHDLFEDRITVLLDHPHLAAFHRVYAAQFGQLLLERGLADVARRFALLADRSPTRFGAEAFSLALRRLDANLCVLDDPADGVARLQVLVDEAAASGRTALVSMLEHDLAAVAADQCDEPPTMIEALGPRLMIRRPGDEPEPLGGQPAQTLAWLIASDGAIAVDVVLEALWPGVEPSVGRNRLHGVLLRLRRSLGVGADGPIRCGDDLVELDRHGSVCCDVWDLSPSECAAAADEVLSEQFRYDDRVERFRSRLSAIRG